jgi:Flp pilus assembly protein TadG
VSARHASCQRGQSATELLVVLPVLVLLLFGTIQLGLMYQARSTLNHATMLAARAGALHNGDHGAMRNALARGLTPLFASEASATGYAEALAKASLETATASNITRIEILNPTGPALADFGRTRLDGEAGRELPNDTLHYRTTAAGSTSNISVQDANLLHVRVTYCYRLIVPVIDRMLHAAVNAVSTPTGGVGMSNPFGIGAAPAAGARCAATGVRGPRIEIRSEAVLRMQSSFYEANLGGSGGTGTPGEPPDTGVPVDPEEPGNPTDPTDPTDPEEPPGGPTC